MTQTRKWSVIETVTSTAIGYAVAMAAQAVILPLFGLTPTLGENAGIAALFTAVSLVRGYCVRRLFVAVNARASRRKQLADAEAERLRAEIGAVERSISQTLEGQIILRRTWERRLEALRERLAEVEARQIR